MIVAQSKIRLHEAAHAYLDGLARRRKAESTLRNYRGLLQKFIDHVGDIQVANVQPNHVEDFFFGPKGLTSVHVTNSRGQRTNKPISDDTFNTYRQILRAFYLWNVKKAYIRPGNDWFEAVDRMEVQTQPRMQLGAVELMEVLDAASKPRDRMWLALLMNTAKRSNELARLKVGQIDLDAGFIRRVMITKTKLVDDIPISADLDAELRAWLVAYAEDLGRPLDEEDYLFPVRRGYGVKSVIDPATAERSTVKISGYWDTSKHIKHAHLIVQDAMRKLGYSTHKEGGHTIRRSVSRVYFDIAKKEDGAISALKETSAMLDHKTLSTTERYIGTTGEKEKRDDRLRGKPFLSALVTQENVVPLRKA